MIFGVMNARFLIGTVYYHFEWESERILDSYWPIMGSALRYE